MKKPKGPWIKPSLPQAPVFSYELGKMIQHRNNPDLSLPKHDERLSFLAESINSVPRYAYSLGRSSASDDLQLMLKQINSEQSNNAVSFDFEPDKKNVQPQKRSLEEQLAHWRKQLCQRSGGIVPEAQLLEFVEEMYEQRLEELANENAERDFSQIIVIQKGDQDINDPKIRRQDYDANLVYLNTKKYLDKIQELKESAKKGKKESGIKIAPAAAEEQFEFSRQEDPHQLEQEDSKLYKMQMHTPDKYRLFKGFAKTAHQILQRERLIQQHKEKVLASNKSTLNSGEGRSSGRTDRQLVARPTAVPAAKLGKGKRQKDQYSTGLTSDRIQNYILENEQGIISPNELKRAWQKEQNREWEARRGQLPLQEQQEAPKESLITDRSYLEQLVSSLNNLNSQKKK